MDFNALFKIFYKNFNERYRFIAVSDSAFLESNKMHVRFIIMILQT